MEDSGYGPETLAVNVLFLGYVCIACSLAMLITMDAALSSANLEDIHLQGKLLSCNGGGDHRNGNALHESYLNWY